LGRHPEDRKGEGKFQIRDYLNIISPWIHLCLISFLPYIQKGPKSAEEKMLIKNAIVMQLSSKTILLIFPASVLERKDI
jgi:hypothetical protein